MPTKTFLLFCFLFLHSCLLAQTNLNQGLVAHYPLDGSANDVSGNNFNGTMVGSPGAAIDRFGNAGKALKFNGSAEFIRIPDNGSFSTASVSISLWFATDKNGIQALMGKRSFVAANESELGFFCRGGNNGGLTAFVAGNNKPCSGPVVMGTSGDEQSLDASICLNRWYHLVVTIDNGRVEQYLNGQLLGGKSLVFTTRSGCNTELRLGNWWQGDGAWFQGRMDDVRWYNRKLSTHEISALTRYPALPQGFDLSLGACTTTICNNWLFAPSQPSLMRVGDLDITGDQVTVEATFNRTAPWSGADVFQGDLVSKHEDSRDVNYLLRPSSAEITTSNGYFKTPVVCPIELNKTYHAAMVYNGRSLKFYRNGFLLSEIPASGSLVTNNWATQVGLYFNGITREQFVGYINEVKIWNIARTQDEIQTYMNQSLPNPQALAGLKAYYTFDNLQNKQGNSLFDGVLEGMASIGATNPSCDFIADSCGIVACSDFKGPDFSFQHQACTPEQISLYTPGRPGETYQWQFPDGSRTNASTATYRMVTPGAHAIKLVTTYQSCKDSLEKTIAYQPASGNLIINPDTTICTGGKVTITTRFKVLDTCWQFSTPDAGWNSSQQLLSPASDTRVLLKAVVPTGNLIQNGDFSSNNTAVNSAYVNNPQPGAPGIRVASSTSGWGAVDCAGGTINGNMLLVRSAADRGKVVWKQTFAVTPGANYLIAFRLLGLSTTSDPLVQWQINGRTVSADYGVTISCAWQQQMLYWNAGTENTIELALASTNTKTDTRSFAIDDLFMGPYRLQDDTLSVKVMPFPKFSVTTDTAVCPGTSLALKVSTTEPPSAVKWLETAGNSHTTGYNKIVQPGTNSIYPFVVQNAAGCSITDSVKIGVLPQPQYVAPRRFNICQGQTVNKQMQYVNTRSVVWQPAGLVDSTFLDQLFAPAKTTKYKVKLTSAEGCTAEDSILIEVTAPPQPTVSSTGDINCLQPAVKLNAGGGATYRWSPGAGLSDSTIAAPTASPRTTTRYTVRVFDQAGCYADKSVLVSVNNTALTAPFVPNAFTPNNDGRNDCFRIPALQGALSYHLRIFNRWGQIVFDSIIPTQCWNGRYNGYDLPAGVYVYQLEAVTICATTQQKGFITLIR